MSELLPSPPGPRFRTPLGPLLGFRRDPLGFLEQLRREHGDYVHFRIGRQDMYLLSDPEAIRDILVTNHRNFIKSRALQRARAILGQGLLTSEGSYHLRQRRMVQPSFHRDRIAEYARVMIAHATETAGRWNDGEELDMSREMMRLTLRIAGKTLLGEDVEGEADEIGGALTDALSLFDRLTVPFGHLLDRLPLPSTRRFWRARARLDATIHRVIAERRRSGRDEGDLLSSLLRAQDEEDGGTRMTDEQLRDELLTIFLAGHETTANALTWTWILLARHPEAESRLHAELDEVLDGGAPTPDDFPRLEYTRRVLAESMRMFPPAWTLGREPLADFEAGGFRIRARSIVLMSPWIVHRDSRWFPDPLRFEPDRWSAEGEAALPRFAYFPFGGGPRKCVGEGFAWMEGVLVLASLASRWRARLVREEAIVPEPTITLRLREGAPMRLQRRSSGPAREAAGQPSLTARVTRSSGS